ncbi:MAG: efflux RND transporter permease subunit [Sedimentisphaerales bacterium]|nr:efflux RND transporter permease subunit [Sedimentisphaerales bacterium]
MRLAQFSVNKPVTTLMIFVAMVVLGVASLSLLGIDLLPNIEIPAISIVTRYEGAGPEEIETLLTKPIEDVLSTISHVDEVLSVSKEGVSSVTLKFDWGENIDEAANDVREKLDMVKEHLPEEAETPVVFKFNVDMFPIMIVGISAGDSYPRLEKIVEDQIADPLKRVDGVAAAAMYGGLQRQVRVEVSQDRLASLNLSLGQLLPILASQNVSVPGGNIRSGHKDFVLRMPEEFASPEEVGEVIVAAPGGVPVKLNDIAEIKDFFKERTYDVRLNGERAMAVFVQKQSGGNTVEVSRAVHAKLKEIQPALPPDVQVNVVVDSSEFIMASVHNLRSNVLWAILFVFFVILFFVGSFRASLIVATSVPTSLIITFLLMYLAGYTVNTTSLAALAVAVGEVVDAAIVVVDNIHRHRQKGQRARESAIHGTNEVGVAVIASTLTTVAIFVPIMFVGGITRIIFGQFAMIVTMSLVASLLTSLMLVPMLCSKLLKGEERGRVSGLGLFYRWGERILTWIEGRYSRLLAWSLRNRKTVLGSCALIFLWCLGLTMFVGREFFPREDQNQLQIAFELPVGTRYERTGLVGQQMAEIVSGRVPESRDVYVRWGVVDEAGAEEMAGDMETYTGLLFIKLADKKKRKASPQEIIERVRPVMDRLPDTTVRYDVRDPFEEMIFGTGGALSIELYGHDVDRGVAYAERVKSVISQVKGVEDVTISRKEEKPEIRIVVDREKAARLGLDVRTIGKTVEAMFAGTTATRYREGGEEYDVRIRLRPEDRQRIQDLRDVYMNTPLGGQVCLANFARMEPGVGPSRIERKDQARYVTVSGQVRGRDLGSVAKDVRAAIGGVPAPPGFTYRIGGAEEQRQDAFRLLIIATALGMVLVYMVMASQFESYRDPFIIFLSVPFGIVGVTMVLALTGIPMSIVTFISLILLIGLVVNNGIVLVSYIGILRQRGYDTLTAIMEGGRSRLRPILSTTLTTLLAVTPLVFSRGAGSEIWGPFAVASIGGMTLSTLITLVLMPTLYSLFEGVKISDMK